MSAFSTPDPDPVSPTLKHAFGWALALAVLLTVVGLFAVLVPIVFGVAFTLIVGWAFTLVGILHLFLAWKTHSTRGVLWEILLAILYLFTGLYLIVHPLAGLEGLTLLLGAYFLIKGVMEIVHFFQLQPRHGSYWLLIDGVVCLVLAAVIWKSWPSSSVWVLGTLVGISILFTGISRLMLTMTARRALIA